ncbi:hypothetical protein PV04_07843 [Phialophora macrospora]|uniref:CBM1 domain-containing protein n=1 Tax=Phialophora macrospora TaxID=1851006 RepID=A0A0D2FC85_9EURO|nr:hypothetical protein PV04_07843 [Phialophora macrospora]
MPAVRSFFALSVLAACLAQVSAGGDSGSGGYGGGDQYGGGQGGGQGGGSWGGQGQGGAWGGNKQYTSAWQASTTTEVAVQTCPPQTCPPPYTQTKTETTTVTAVSPCMGSTVTAYVTQWQNAPPGCWCGPPPTGLPSWDWGSGAGGAVAAPVFTASVSITPGLSSIPASEAVKTGVTVAGPPPAMATATVSPGGFFGESSASAAASSVRCGFPAQSFDKHDHKELVIKYHRHSASRSHIFYIHYNHDNHDNFIFFRKYLFAKCGSRLRPCWRQ